MIAFPIPAEYNIRVLKREINHTGLRQEKYMFNFLKKPMDKKSFIYSPVRGKIKALSEVDDEAFRSEKMGKTVAIEPMENTIYAPVNGVVKGIFPTCQSISIVSDSGQNILLHIGVNTHLLNGTGFISHIHKDDKITVGKRILEIDREMMVSNDYDPTILIIITNSSDYQDIKVLKDDLVQVKDELMLLEG